MIDVIVLLTIKDTSSFRKYEKAALSRLPAHGGSLVAAFEPEPSADVTAVDEIHYLRFPDTRAYKNFRNDKTLSDLSDLRSMAISNTTIYTSRRQIPYQIAGHTHKAT